MGFDDILPSDEAVLELLARKRKLLAELSEINTALQRVIGQTTRGPRRKSAGRPVDETNEWARAQLKSGVAREAVYQEWLRRKEREDDAQAKDNFRKIIARTID